MGERERGRDTPGVSDTQGGVCTRQGVQRSTPTIPNQKDPGQCSVCFTTYDSERRPRTLPCGHTFCTPCIDSIMEDGQLPCPICRTNHRTSSVTQFPISYDIEAFVKQTASRKQSTRIKKIRPLLEEQKNSVETGIQEVQSQLDQYRAQLADWKTQHLHLLDRLYSLVEQNKKALELLEQEDTRVVDMKTEGETKLEALLGSLQPVNPIQEVDTAIDCIDKCTMLAEDWKQKCQELCPNIKIILTSKKVREVSRTALEIVPNNVGAADVDRRTLETESATAHATEAVSHLVDPTLSIMKKVEDIIAQGQLQVEDLCRMRPPVKRLVEAGRMYGVQEDQGGLRSSRITLENGQLYLHCLLNQPPPPHAHTLPVSEVVGALDPSSTMVFLDLCWPGSTRGRVHIRLSPDTSLARQFVLLCTGQCGHSYLNTVLLEVWRKDEKGELVFGGDYEYNNGEGGASLLPHPNHQYRESENAGAVWSSYGLGSNNSAQFVITTRDRKDGGEWPYVFGEVERGLEVVRAAVNHSDIKQVTVVDCGVVVSL